jgi:hypothetical protein
MPTGMDAKRGQTAPQEMSDHAKQIAKAIKRCPHGEEEWR